MSDVNGAPPIAASLMTLPDRLADGRRIADGSPDDWARQLRQVALLGFDTIEVPDRWLPLGELGAAARADFAAAAAATGVGIAALAVVRSSILDPVHADRNLARSHRAIDAAAAVGAGLVSLGLHRELTPEQDAAEWFWLAPSPRDDDAPATRQRAVDGFRELGRHAAEVGVQLSLEVYEDTLIGTAEGAVRLIGEIGMPNVGLNPDIANIVRLHRPVEDWREALRRMMPVANHWHVKNYVRDHDPRTGAYFTAPAPLAHGVINYRAAVAEAVELGFDGLYTCEHYGGDGLAVAAQNRGYLLEVLGAAHRSEVRA